MQSHEFAKAPVSAGGTSLRETVHSALPAIALMGLLYCLGLVFKQSSYHLNTFKFGMAAIYVSALFLTFLVTIGIGAKDRTYFIHFVLFEGLLFFYVYQFIISLLPISLNYEPKFYLSGYLIMLGWSFLIALTFQTEERLRWASYLAVTLLLALGINGILEVINYKGFLRLTFGHRNYLAGFLVGMIFLPFPIAIASIRRSPRRLIDYLSACFAFLAVCAGLLCLVFTGSRAALAGAGVGVVVLVATLALILGVGSSGSGQRDRRRRLRRWGVLGCAAVFLLASVGVGLYRVMPLKGGRVLEVIKNPAWHIANRTMAWKISWEIWKESPVFGNGFGSLYPRTFTDMQKHYRVHNPTRGYKHAHNEYLEILQDAGILGALIYLVILIFVGTGLVRIILRRDRPLLLRVTAGSVTAGLAGMMAHAPFTVAHRMAVAQMAFFLLIGLAGGMISMDAIRDRETGMGALWRRGIGRLRKRALMHVMVLGFLLCILPAAYYITRVYWASEYFHDKANRSGQRKGLAYIAQAVERNPENVYARYLQLQMDLFRLGRGVELDQLIKAADRIEALVPGYFETALVKARAHIQMGDLDRAEVELKRQLSMEYYLSTSYYFLMKLYHVKGDKESFTRVFRQTIEKDLRFWVAKMGRIMPQRIETRWVDKETSLCKVEINPREKAALELPLPFVERSIAVFFGPRKRGLLMSFRTAMARFYHDYPIRDGIKAMIKQDVSEYSKILL